MSEKEVEATRSGPGSMVLEIPNGSPDVAREVQLYIAGTNGFDNELFADYLQAQTGFACHCLAPARLKNILGQSNGTTRLILLDCSGLSAPALWKLLNIERESGAEHSFLVLTRVNAAWEIEQQALDFGVRGILYATQTIALYPQAVQAIINGELWYPRSALETRLKTGNSLSLFDKETASLLSKREKEILTLLASGLSNQTIAEKLCISPHTVKTHAYNIYKKINVDNRLHAALWLSQNTSRR